MVGLSSLEIAVYFGTWICSALFSMYSCCAASNQFADELSNDLSQGWNFLGRKYDSSDYEWNVFTPLLRQWLLYISVYLSISQILRHRMPQLIPIFSIFIGFLWLYNKLGLSLSVALIAQPVLLHTIAKMSSLKVVWATCLSVSLSLHIFLIPLFSQYSVFPDSTVEYLFPVLLFWTYARTISYLSDTGTGVSEHSYTNLFHYCFYLPLLPTGPLVCHRDFQKSVTHQVDWNLAWQNIFTIIRCVFWWVFHDIALHYSYHTALQYRPYLVEQMGIWAAAGLGYSLAQFFMIKYFVFYALPASLAHFDCVSAPPPPKCISRIHLYSQMWRDFDRGLYNFMVYYIYIPIKGKNDSLSAKLWGSAITFLFVCIWHGGTSAVVIWCIFNYLGICLERLAGLLSANHAIIRLKERMSENNWMRFTAVVASPLLLMSALSNFYFFSDATVGHILVRKALFEGGFYRLSLIMLVMYCCCHVSMVISSRESSKMKKG